MIPALSSSPHSESKEEKEAIAVDDGFKVLQFHDILPDILPPATPTSPTAMNDDKINPILQSVLGKLESLEMNIMNRIPLIRSLDGGSTPSMEERAAVPSSTPSDSLVAVVETESIETSNYRKLQSQIDELKAALSMTGMRYPVDSGNINSRAQERLISFEGVQSLNGFAVEMSGSSNSNYEQTRGDNDNYEEDYEEVKNRTNEGNGKWTSFFESQELNSTSEVAKSIPMREKERNGYSNTVRGTSSELLHPQLSRSRTFPASTIEPVLVPRHRNRNRTEAFKRSDGTWTSSNKEGLQMQTTNYSERHDMPLHHRQHSDEGSIASLKNHDTMVANGGGVQIVEHVAYTIDHQPLHVTEKIYPKRRSYSPRATISKSSSFDSTTSATEQLSKALGSFLEVINKCNETSSNAMDVVNAVDNSLLGLKSPIVPSIRHISLSSPKVQSENHSVILPMYETPASGTSVITDSARNELQYTGGSHETEEKADFASESEVLPQQLNTPLNEWPSSPRYTNQQHENYHSDRWQSKGNKEYIETPRQSQLRRSISFQSSLSGTVTSSATSSVYSNHGENHFKSHQHHKRNQLPHYATATKSSLAGVTTAQIAQVMNSSSGRGRRRKSPTKQRTSPSRRRQSPGRVPSAFGYSSGSETGQRYFLNSEEWSVRESLSTRKSPLAYSFPSDSKPRLCFEPPPSLSLNRR